MPDHFEDQNDENQFLQEVKINKPNFFKKEITPYYAAEAAAETPGARRSAGSVGRIPLNQIKNSNSIAKHELPAAGKATGITNPSPKKSLVDLKAVNYFNEP